MNILIYFGNQINPINGGTERVAYLISRYLMHRGHSVTYLCSHTSEVDGSIPSYVLPLENESACKKNIQFVKDLIKKNNIDTIINEGGNGEAVYLFSHKYLGDDIKIITHLHFDVLGDIRNFYKSLYLPITGVDLRTACVNFLKRIKSPYNRYISLKNKRNRFRFMLDESDTVVTLSQRHVKDYKALVRKGNFSKLKVLRNPISYEAKNINFSEKDNSVLFVGRLDYASKRIDRILRMWKLIEAVYPEWTLSIVGDGNDNERLRLLSHKLKLNNVRFEGRTDSEPFYKKAKIMVMTSNYEGTPMVIPEAMAYGAIPVIMDTFAGAHDIITDGINGYLTKPFSINNMAKTVMSLISDDIKLKKMSKSAMATVSDQKNCDILSEWDNILNKTK